MQFFLFFSSFSLNSKFNLFFFFFTISSTSMEHFPNFNLELCLSPPSSSPSTNTTTNSTTLQHNHVAPDPTELQAKAIIVEATRQMEAQRRWSTCGISSPAEPEWMKSGEGSSPAMRRSLQRFLQKRKLRIQTISPYTH